MNITIDQSSDQADRLQGTKKIKGFKQNAAEKQAKFFVYMILVLVLFNAISALGS